MNRCSISPDVADTQGFTEIVFRETPNPEVHFTSGKTTYVESLLSGRWVGRFWSAEGIVGDPADFWESDAFEVRVKEEPSGPDVPGKLLSSGWEFVSASEEPAARECCREFKIKLSSAIAPITLEVCTLLDGTAVLTRWLEITNTSEGAVAITYVFPWSGKLWAEDGPFTLGHALRWEFGNEGWFGWTPLEPGANVFKNDKGLVADAPYFILRNHSYGGYFVGQLAWSVNYTMEFERGNGLAFKIGPSAVNVLRVIEPGETVITPPVHLGYIKEGFDAVVQAMHEHIRRSVIPKRNPERAYLVQYLLPEDQPLTVYRKDGYTEENLKKCMDVAAAIGAEVFIVDGPTWAEGHGNWAPKKEWFPRGFDPLVEYAHRKGLLFGVYAEPEGGRGDWSETVAFKEHREWFVERLPRWPGAYSLNISIPGTAAYMESELAEIVDRCKLDLYRHDQNAYSDGEGSETVRDGFVENDYWRHYEAFYAISERTRGRYPDLILQQASAGGCRLDLGTAARYDEHYTSDGVGMPKVFQMLAGLTAYLPPEILVTPFGMATGLPDFTTLLRGIFALGNTPFIFNGVLPKSLEELTPTIREKWLRYSTLYKGFIRPLLPTCKVYHHHPVNAMGGVASGKWFAMEFTSPESKKAWALIVQLWPQDSWKDGGDAYLFKPRGLGPDRKYTVTFDNTGKKEAIQGSGLRDEGLPIRLSWQEGDPASELLLFETNDDT